MISHEYDERIPSFFEVDRMIIAGDAEGILFTEDDKGTYRNFANQLQSIFNEIEKNASYVRDIDIIITKLAQAYRDSMLEEYVQYPSSITHCLIRGKYFFRNRSDLMYVWVLRDFVQLLKSSGLDKQRVIIANLWQRLDSIKRYEEIVDDLPF